jgi:hypothetical protein
MFTSDAHAAAVHDDVLGLQLPVDLVLVDAELSQPLPRDFGVDHFLLFGKEIDLLHILHGLKLPAQELGIAAELRKRVPLAADRQEDAVDVAEVIHDHRPPTHGRRELRLHVGDFAAQLIPDLQDAG